MPTLLPDADILTVASGKAVFLSLDGEIETLSLADGVRRAAHHPPIVCHRPLTVQRLGGEAFPAFDVLELFAFARPTLFCLPTPRGMAEALGLSPIAPDDAEDTALRLMDIVCHLLDRLGEEFKSSSADRKRETEAAARLARRGNWPWASFVLAALGLDDLPPDTPPRPPRPWDLLREWQPVRPEPPATHHPIETAAVRSRLAELLGSDAEQRPQQADYASAAALAFAPRNEPGTPAGVLAEAGTGTGKTIAYIVPSSLWAHKNDGTVWISTYTRNLQRQLDTELTRLYPDPVEKMRRVAIRKGRENYLCLLNLEEALHSPTAFGDAAFLLAIACRWATFSRDGDITGGDFPGWLTDLGGSATIASLPDRRGECLYSACPHYRKCFIEATVNKGHGASIVVANHALVMMQVARGNSEDSPLPVRYIFDEGHHLFDAADSVFSGHLTGMETGELRRWLLGAEGGGRSRARGLKRRLEEIAALDDKVATALESVVEEARALPAPGWRLRMADNAPHGPIEKFLALIRQQVLARTDGQASPYSLETPLFPLLPGLDQAANEAQQALGQLARTVGTLLDSLNALLDDEAATLEAAYRQRITAIGGSLEYRALNPLMGWQDMLQQIIAPPVIEGPEPPSISQVSWLGLERIDSAEIDTGMHRHWIDPTDPFMALLSESAHGFLVTSATLRDTSVNADDERSWHAAEQRCGTIHLPHPAVRAAMPSPFDYPDRTRVFVLNDVARDNIAHVSAAYRELFLASGGGALGLFTAISRLREVQRRIRPALDSIGLPLFAQHVDDLSTSTLIDLFRAEEHACLLGTDAMRDGVDVPGSSLRLVVFDRIPWPRPDILHKARRAAFGGSAYDDAIVRMRLKQAFGRLIRRESDRGVFVMLDPMMPSRLKGAFPTGVDIVRIGLADAVREIRAFLAV